MAILLPRYNPMHPAKRSRRNATAVMAGNFDIRPARDALTSLLNGVGPYKVVERDEQAKRKRKQEKKERERERRTALKAQKAQAEEAVSNIEPNVASTSSIPHPPLATTTTSYFWKAHTRPAIHIATGQRSLSVTPPPITSPVPLPSTPASTPGPSNSSSTSRTSSKRPHTPDDYDEFDLQQASIPPASPVRQPKKRVAAKKGWKGWVEGSPPPSEKLINLDAVPILQERRTRSGKNFDAIGVGKEGWV